MLGERFDPTLARAAGGDADAFALLWRDLNPVLLRYLRVMAGDLAEDVASETWVKVIDGLARFTGDEQRFRSWVLVIARHTFIDGVRRSGRRPERVTGDVTELPVRPEHHAPDAATVALDRLSTQDAIRLIATLPADQAELVVLRVVAGLDVTRVAAIVGRSPGAVRVAVHRALRRLEQLLTGADETADVTPEGEPAFRRRHG